MDPTDQKWSALDLTTLPSLVADFQKSNPDILFSVNNLLTHLAPILRRKHNLHVRNQGLSSTMLRISVLPDEADDPSRDTNSLTLVAGVIDFEVPGDAGSVSSAEKGNEADPAEQFGLEPFSVEAQQGTCLLNQGDGNLMRYRWGKNRNAIAIIQAFLLDFPEAFVSFCDRKDEEQDDGGVPLQSESASEAARPRVQSLATAEAVEPEDGMDKDYMPVLVGDHAGRVYGALTLGLIVTLTRMKVTSIRVYTT